MQTPRMQEISQESPRKNDSRAFSIPVSFDETKPPTVSNLLSTHFDHYGYHVVLTTNDFSIFSIQAENENYLLYQRKLYSSASALADSQTEEIMCAVDQEEEVLKTYNEKITNSIPAANARFQNTKILPNGLSGKHLHFMQISSLKPQPKPLFQII